MSFVHRPYDEIVVDVLTTLTDGVSQEVIRIDYDPDARPPEVIEVILKRRPVRRVSLVRGLVTNGRDPEGEPQDYSFTLADYELLGGPEDPDDLSTLRFLAGGRRPAPGTDIRVNYYPRSSSPTPITDVNVGSVARTIVEAISREMAQLYQQLNLAYDSAFLDTAEGASLDRVVALLGQARFRAGAAVGTVQFRRRAGSVGNIAIPAGTPVTDGQDSVRYETVDTRQMLAGESVAEVRVRAVSATMPVVDAGVLTVVQRAIAGIDSVSNPRPTSRASADESDADLRARVSAVLLSSNKGTLSAMHSGLLMLPEVKGVSIEEEPNGVPGELKVNVSLAAGGELPAAVSNAIEELRPAGVRVIAAASGLTEITVSVDMTLAGNEQPDSVVAGIQAGVRGALIARVDKLGVTPIVRTGPLVAAILADERIVDAKLRVTTKGSPGAEVGTDLVVPADQAVALMDTDIAFERVGFEQAAPGGTAIPAEVAADIRVMLEPGQALDAVRAGIDERLRGYLAALKPGDQIDHPAVLAALRNDPMYAIDPLAAILTITAGEQFVQISVSGGGFSVGGGLKFTLVSLELVS